MCYKFRDGRCCVFVKAYIATLLGRLEANDGKFWSLLVKINDGTATMDVVISDQVCCGYLCYYYYYPCGNYSDIITESL